MRLRERVFPRPRSCVTGPVGSCPSCPTGFLAVIFTATHDPAIGPSQAARRSHLLGDFTRRGPPGREPHLRDDCACRCGIGPGREALREFARSRTVKTAPDAAEVTKEPKTAFMRSTGAVANARCPKQLRADPSSPEISPGAGKRLIERYRSCAPTVSVPSVSCQPNQIGLRTINLATVEDLPAIAVGIAPGATLSLSSRGFLPER